MMSAVKTPTRARSLADLRKQLTSPGEELERALEVEALSAAGGFLGAVEAERERKGITRSDLAESASMQRTALARLLDETDANPTVRTLVRLLWAAGLHAEITIRQREKSEPHVMRVYAELP